MSSPLWHNIWCAPGVRPWPNPFALYTSPISAIADSHNVLQQQYADDTQLYISISTKTITLNTGRLESCLSDLHAWFSHNWLALSPSISEAENALNVLFSQHLRHLYVPLTTQIKLLGVTLDQSLSFYSHITALSKSCFYHIRALRHIRPILSEDSQSHCLIVLSLPGWTMQMHVCSASLSRIYLAYREFKTLLLLSSHAPNLGPALPLSWNTSTGFQFQLAFTSKIALLTFKSLHTIAPSYLSSLIQPYVHSRALRSSSAHRLCVPHVSSVFGSRGFRSAGPAIWNSLPLSVTSCSTIHTFKKQLKTRLFSSAFPSSWICPRCASDSMISTYLFIWLSLILCVANCML